MALPDAAMPYWRRQQAVTASAVATALSAWRSSGGSVAQWESLLPFLESTVTRAQTFAVTGAEQYVGDALRGLNVDIDPIVEIDPTPLLGVSGNGLPLSSLYARLPEQLELNTNRLVALTKEPAANVFQAALTATGKQLASSVQSTISDTGRAAESLQITARPGVGYARMVSMPACKRCVILAGKFYRWNAGFKRHPKCDCRHIPAPESLAGDVKVNTRRYFKSLTTEQQDEAFGKAGAQAIRDGADMSQVVNADQGMRTAQVYGQNLLITDQGVTKYGYAGQVIRARGRKAATTPRLMPSSIYQIADDRDDAIRLLRMNGYIIDKAEPPTLMRGAAPPAIATPDVKPATAGGTPGGPPPAGPPPPHTAAGDEPEGWSGHVKGYEHPHRAPVWSEAERVRRQADLGEDAVPEGEQLYQHEIEATERLHALGEKVRWIPLGEPDEYARRPPTNDFEWVTNGGVLAELKSTKAKYRTIRDRISNAVLGAADKGVVKDHFVIDIGNKTLKDVLHQQLARYNNSGDPARRIAALWVLTRGQLVQIELK